MGGGVEIGRGVDVASGRRCHRIRRRQRRPGCAPGPPGASRGLPRRPRQPPRRRPRCCGRAAPGCGLTGVGRDHRRPRTGAPGLDQSPDDGGGDSRLVHQSDEHGAGGTGADFSFRDRDEPDSERTGLPLSPVRVVDDAGIRQPGAVPHLVRPGAEHDDDRIAAPVPQDVARPARRGASRRTGRAPSARPCAALAGGEQQPGDAGSVPARSSASLIAGRAWRLELIGADLVDPAPGRRRAALRCRPSGGR